MKNQSPMRAQNDAQRSPDVMKTNTKDCIGGVSQSTLTSKRGLISSS